jgi:predicted RecA/RadA family phage recombinase
MGDASYVRGADDNRLTAAAAIAAGECWQLKDGRAAVYSGQAAAASGDRSNFVSAGQFVMTKTAGIVLLDGGRAFWDHSANAVTFRKVNDRDFYLGRIVGDAASADTTCVVNLNVNPAPDIDLISRDGAISVATGTAAAGGFGLPIRYGSSIGLSLTATNEAQCVDLLSVDRFAVGANAIVEAIIRLGANGSTSAVDFNIGVASATSTTDADAIAESVFFHIDGGALDIFAESDDGTTEVAATDTTVDATAGSAVANRFEFWIDMRDPADVQMYINGVNVLPATVFNVNVAAGPLGLLAHLEKTSGTATAGPVFIDRFIARFSEQNAS